MFYFSILQRETVGDTGDHLSKLQQMRTSPSPPSHSGAVSPLTPQGNFIHEMQRKWKKKIFVWKKKHIIDSLGYAFGEESSLDKTTTK